MGYKEVENPMALGVWDELDQVDHEAELDRMIDEAYAYEIERRTENAWLLDDDETDEDYLAKHGWGGLNGYYL